MLSEIRTLKLCQGRKLTFSIVTIILDKALVFEAGLIDQLAHFLFFRGFILLNNLFNFFYLFLTE